MKSVCVFAGSKEGTDAQFRVQAARLGEEIAGRGMQLVYGGSSAGLMGVVAEQVLHHGGSVIGVMPTGLFAKEAVHRGLSSLIEVKDMYERKAKMTELADAFVALPGGYGTFEELFEVASHAQIGIHKKPIGLLSVSHYYQPLLAMIDHAMTCGFVPEQSRQLLVVADDAVELLNHMQF